MVGHSFPGVNPYLNSVLLQPNGGWEMFHAVHIIQMQQALDAVLPDNYYAAPEKSMQIGLPDGALPTLRTQPDVGVFKEESPTEVSSVAKGTVEPVLEMPLLLPTDEFDLTAVNIYRAEGGAFPGVLVTRIELLSPANLPGGSYHEPYMAKRYDTLLHGINMVELDYIHTMKPILPEIPSYRRRDEGAYPYYVVVSDQRPGVHQMRVFGAAVDAPLPSFIVPLAGEDGVALDLQMVYEKTLAARVFGRIVDYNKPLPNADAYTEADQKRIADLLQQARED